MNFKDRFKEPKTISKFSHLKPYSSNSANYVETSFAKYKAVQDLALYEYKSDLLANPPSDTEEIQSLRSTIDSLNQKIAEYESQHCKSCHILGHENKKLKNKLISFEKNTERLYQENQLLSEQLTLLQQKIEDNPVVETSPSEGIKQYLRKTIGSIESELEDYLQDFERKLTLAENRIEKISSKQLSLSKKSSFTVEEYSKIENEKLSFKKALENKSRTIEEYEKEIYRLGIMIVRFQEKYEELLQGNKDKLNDLKTENFHLKEELNILYLKSEEKSLSKSPTKIPMHLAGQGLNSIHFKLDSTKKVIEEYRSQIDFMTDSYNDQLEKLNIELETLRQSYSQQEKLLLHAQEQTNRHEELVKISQAPLKSQIEDLKSQLSEQKSLVSTQSFQIFALSEENTKLRLEVKESSKQEVSIKYSKLILDFNTNEEILDKTQKSLQLAEKTIKDQEAIINSLKQGFYPHNSPKELLNPDSSTTSSETALKETLQKKNATIEEMRKDLLQSSHDTEKLRLDLTKAIELYKSYEEKCKTLEATTESLLFELQSARIGKSL